MMAQNNWQLKLHDNVEDPYYEITNGPISLVADCGFVGETEDDEELIFKKVVDALNESGIEFRSENALEFKQHIEIIQLQDKLREMEQWKKEAMAAWGPLMDWGQSQKDIKLGSSITSFILERCNRYDELKAENERLNTLVKSQQYTIHMYAERFDDCLKTATHRASEHAALKDRAQKLVEVLEWTLQIVQPWTPMQVREIKMKIKEALTEWNEGKEVSNG